MSELAFDKDGEPIEQHEDCELWRVRRFRNPGMRGTCETVREDDGAPLYVAADCTFLELKRLVGAEPGFYRLDQCDVRRQPVPDAAPAYVSITEGHRNATVALHEDPRDVVIRELARTNADMCRTISMQASDMMRAAAEILRAADGAKLPLRQPPPIDEKVVEDDDDDEETEDDELEPPANVWTVIEQMLPTLQAWLAAQVAKRPPSSTPPPAAAPSPAPSPVAPPAAAPASSTTTAQGSAAAGSSATAPTPVVVPSATEPPAAEPAAEIRNAAPTPEQVAHLLAIRSQLMPREAAIADAVVLRMSPEMRAQWLGELSAMSVDQAVEIVRSMIPKPQPPPTKDGG